MIKQSIDDGHLISRVVHRHTKVYLLFLRLLELQIIHLRILISLEYQLSSLRNSCHRQSIILVEIPRSVLFIDSRIASPTVAIIRYLNGSVAGLVKFITITLCLTFEGDTSSYPSFDAIHLQLYCSFFVTYTWLDQRKESILVVR